MIFGGRISPETEVVNHEEFAESTLVDLVTAGVQRRITARVNLSQIEVDSHGVAIPSLGAVGPSGKNESTLSFRYDRGDLLFRMCMCSRYLRVMVECIECVGVRDRGVSPIQNGQTVSAEVVLRQVSIVAVVTLKVWVASVVLDDRAAGDWTTGEQCTTVLLGRAWPEVSE